ncbi:hypothetical protein [Caballeronia sp. INSB1]|jgi:hypothetical protein|uniref:hypothetical protein n=1 Tax=Caballeronia sp. INSB1 TaxID=2921751 RepID=UPI002032EE0F|nr:hypothetical protein [Caballeronia sp. INSB1]
MTDEHTPDVGEGRKKSGDAIEDADIRQKLDDGDSEKIDAVLEDLGVTKHGDDAGKPDTEGSNSSSKNLDDEKS